MCIDLHHVDGIRERTKRLHNRNGYCMIPADDERYLAIVEGQLHRFPVQMCARIPGVAGLQIAQIQYGFGEINTGFRGGIEASPVIGASNEAGSSGAPPSIRGLGVVRNSDECQARLRGSIR